MLQLILIDYSVFLSYAIRYNILTDDAKCFKLLNMEINPQFVDRCTAQIHFMYKKRKKAGN